MSIKYRMASVLALYALIAGLVASVMAQMYGLLPVMVVILIGSALRMFAGGRAGLCWFAYCGITLGIVMAGGFVAAERHVIVAVGAGLVYAGLMAFVAYSLTGFLLPIVSRKSAQSQARAAAAASQPAA